MSGFNDFKTSVDTVGATVNPSAPRDPRISRDAIDRAVARAHALRAAAIRRAGVQLAQTVASLWRRPRKIPQLPLRPGKASA